MPDLAAVILAAGGSRRMGRSKQLLTLGGRSLVRRAADAAQAAGCRPIIIVAGSHVAEICNELAGLAVLVVENTNWEKGIGTSIRKGVGALLAKHPAADRLVLLLCDQPGVTEQTIRRLDEAQERSNRPVCVSAYSGTIGPPVIVTGEFVKKLIALPDDSGAKSIWADHADSVQQEPCPEAVADVDTPADYEAARRDFE